MDPELSDWTPGSGPETDRLAALVATHDRDLRRVAVAITGDAARAERAVLATWAWAQRRRAAVGRGSEARSRLLRRVAREARRRTAEPWFVRLRDLLPSTARRVVASDPGRDPAVAATLGSLTVEDRQMLALRYAVGLTTDEIAAQLDLTGPGVRTHLDDLRRELRPALGISRVDEKGDALTEREVDGRIALRLLAHLDRRAAPMDGDAAPGPMAPDADTTARLVVHRAARPPRLRRRPVIVTALGVLLVVAVVLPLSLLPRGEGTTSGTPTPSPGSLLAVSGWQQRSVVRIDGTVEILGWAPDGAHVAVAEALARQIAVYDQQGTLVRTFAGTDAAWIDARQLLVLTDDLSGAHLVLRSLDGSGDILVTWNGQGPPSTLVARGGSVAVSFTTTGGAPFGAPAVTQLTFSVLHAGTFVPGPTGIPLAWTPDGTRLAYLASPSIASGGYRGQLHVLDAATMSDRNLGLTVVQIGPLVIDPLGRHLLACVAPTNGSPSCVLGLVDLEGGSVQASSIRGQTAVAAWAPDGSVLVEDDGTVLRWALGDEPVALRWQPEHGDRVLGMATAGGWFAVGLLQGPAAPRLIAGAAPPMVVVSGPGVHSLAGTPDGRHLAYGQLLRGSTTIVLASLPAAPALPSASPATVSPSPAPSAGASFEGAPILPLDQTWTVDLTANGPPVSWGPHVYLQSGGYESGDVSGTWQVIPLRLSVLDITTKAELPIDLPIADDELGGRILTDGSNLVVEVYRPLGPRGSDTTPCPSDTAQSVAWRILSAPLAENGVPRAPFRVLDSGTASRIFTPAGQGVTCATTLIPPVAVADGLAAYAVEAPTSTDPWATRVILRRLSDGAIVRRDLASATVPWLNLSSGVLAWTEDPDASVSSAGTFTLWAALPIDAPARTITLPGDATRPSAPWFLMSGSSLLYASYDPTGVGPPTIWRMDLGTGSTAQLSPPLGQNCGPMGASSGVVLVRCDSVNGSGATLVWRAGHGWVVLDGVGGLVGVTIGGGWVVLTDYSGQDPRLIGFPLSELGG